VPVVPVILVCPVGWFNIGGVCLFGQFCPPGTEFANGCCVYRDCPASYVRIFGQCVPPPRTCGIGETYSEGRCEGPKCPGGLVPQPQPQIRTLLPNGSLPNGAGCPEGQRLINDRCQPVPGGDGGRNVCNTYCGCPPGTRVREDGTCVPTNECPPNMVRPERAGQNGLLRPNGPGSNGPIGDRCICADGYESTDGGRTCRPTNTCGPNMVIRNNECVCAEGFQWADGRCLPTNGSGPSSSRCEAPSILMGGACCSPEAVAAGLCGGPPPGLRPVCQPPKVMSDGRCVCPPGTEGETCQKPPKKTCGEGLRLVDGECVRPLAKKKKKKRPPKRPEERPRQPATTTQPMPGLDIGIGIGIGGGGRGGGPRPGGTPPGGGGGGGGRGRGPG
jgi:hypothetical protein